MPKAQKRYFELSSIVLMVGLVMFAIGLFSFVQYIRFEARAVKTVGTVVKINKERIRRGSHHRGSLTLARPVVRFETQAGTETTAVATGSPSHHYALGERVDVEFDPAQPMSSLRVDHGPSWLDLGLGMLGLGFIAGGLAKPRRQRRAQKSQAKTTASAANKEQTS